MSLKNLTFCGHVKKVFLLVHTLLISENKICEKCFILYFQGKKKLRKMEMLNLQAGDINFEVILFFLNFIAKLSLNSTSTQF